MPVPPYKRPPRGVPASPQVARLMADLEQLSQVSGTGDIGVGEGGGGRQILDGRPQGFWAKITGHTSDNKYAFERVDDGAGGAYPPLDATDPFEGDGTAVVAYEVNGRADVPADGTAKVWLEPNRLGPGYTFAYGEAAAPPPVWVAYGNTYDQFTTPGACPAGGTTILAADSFVLRVRPGLRNFTDYYLDGTVQVYADGDWDHDDPDAFPVGGWVTVEAAVYAVGSDNVPATGGRVTQWIPVLGGQVVRPGGVDPDGDDAAAVLTGHYYGTCGHDWKGQARFQLPTGLRMTGDFREGFIGSGLCWVVKVETTFDCHVGFVGGSTQLAAVETGGFDYRTGFTDQPALTDVEEGDDCAVPTTVAVPGGGSPNPDYDGPGWYKDGGGDCVHYDSDPGAGVTITGGPFLTSDECDASDGGAGYYCAAYDDGEGNTVPQGCYHFGAVPPDGWTVASGPHDTADACDPECPGDNAITRLYDYWPAPLSLSFSQGTSPCALLPGATRVTLPPLSKDGTAAVWRVAVPPGYTFGTCNAGGGTAPAYLQVTAQPGSTDRVDVLFAPTTTLANSTVETGTVDPLDLRFDFTSPSLSCGCLGAFAKVELL